MLLIGSHALKYFNLLTRKPSDVDVICTFEEYNDWIRANKPNLTRFYPISKNKNVVYHKNGTIYEFEIAWEDSSAYSLLTEYANNHIMHTYFNEQLNCDVLVATPNLCYTLKMSHRFLRNNPFFEKTWNDIQWLRKNGCEITSELSTWYTQREKETYDYSHPSLKQNKKDFFDTPGVVYTYDHDSIHQAIKLYDKPAYTYFKDDEAEVYCSKSKFEPCPHHIKLASVMEESYVLALERCLVPFDFKTPPNVAFKMALQKVCTSITSGWWRAWAWEHYQEALNNYSDDYVVKFKRGLETGIIKEHILE